MRPTVTTFLAAGALLTTTSCARLDRAAGPPHASAGGAATTVTAVLLDRTESTDARQVRERYFADFQRLLDTLKDGDAVHGFPVTASAASTAFADFQVDMPTYDPLQENADQHRAEVAAARAAAVAGGRKLLVGHDPEPGTDLFSAIDQAGRSLAVAPRGARKKLVIFSDMVQQTREADFTRDRLGTRTTGRVIGRIAATGRLPDLRGVDVTVAGAGGGDPARSSAIRAFWLAYFRRCGAILPPERYGLTIQGLG